MSTRFTRIIHVNNTFTQIELIRDGFNIWFPNGDDGCDFSAKYEQVFSQALWVYEDSKPNPEKLSILGTLKHRAIFETESDVTDYMVWRIQRHMQTPGLDPVKTGKPYPTEDIERIEELMTDNWGYGMNYDEWLRLHRVHGDNLLDVFAGTSWTTDEVVDKMMLDMQEMDKHYTELGKEYRAMKGIPVTEGDGDVYPQKFQLVPIDKHDKNHEDWFGEPCKIITDAGNFVTYSWDTEYANGYLAGKYGSYSLTRPLPTAAPQADNIETTVSVYQNGNYDIECRENYYGRGVTKFVVTHGGGDPVDVFDGIKDAIAYVDNEVNPQADSEATGYTVEKQTWATGDGYYIEDASGKSVSNLYADEGITISFCAVLNTQTATLRAENARLRGELEAARGRVSAMEVDSELSPAIQVGGGTVFINPGTGIVRDATEANAITNIQAFIRDCISEDTGLADMVYERNPDEDDGNGRFGFVLRWRGLTVEIQMPGWELERVRYVDAEGQNIWHFPRLYVDGSSWVWTFAINVAVGQFTDEDTENE